MIRLYDVHKSFGDQKVLRGLNLEIPAGQITAIIGPSGEGKSVLIKHMIGLLEPDRGRIEVEGESILGVRRSTLNRIREKFGMLFQNAALFDSMTVFENVAFPLQEKTSLSRDEISARVYSALEDVGLKNVGQKYADELSGGMKKRVGLARALLLNPKIILFDEPTTGLDPIIKRAIHQLIKETHEKFGFTAVIVSHEIPDIFDIAQNVAMLYQGTILQNGSAAEIMKSDHPVVKQFISGSLDGPIRLI
ncbi:ABC transporter ATP-binding protein [Geobacter sp. SVR]|uniref:ABC transporter ATP-binding protein n=1 Tax=Geobacter sp. SVR TaxID=2495594 RepID=UPI00143EFD01|nr:ABC transporter ATP-binding protein [Geobacter sp. SVR]BCS55591.1 ABC transporter ATP-binding protein [Geobacter sp. SVR]GCF83594.1 ABC transporter ATP-binding protein [Geobacter sp. SVR]